jgi:hypothetical protein
VYGPIGNAAEGCSGSGSTEAQEPTIAARRRPPQFAVHTNGAVIGPAEVIMLIVPAATPSRWKQGPRSGLDKGPSCLLNRARDQRLLTELAINAWPLLQAMC